jgi:hypothetical protein
MMPGSREARGTETEMGVGIAINSIQFKMLMMLTLMFSGVMAIFRITCTAMNVGRIELNVIFGNTLLSAHG